MDDKNAKVVAISLNPADVWRYSLEHKKQLEESLVSIASNAKSGWEIFLTIENDSTMIYVYDGEDQLVHEEAIISNDDAILTVRKMYERYLGYDGPDDSDGEDEDEEFDFRSTMHELEDEMYEREMELYDAMYDFLSIALDNAISVYFGRDEEDDAVSGMVDSVCRILAVKYGISVRRPSIETDKNGNEVYVEFPYDELTTEEEEEPSGE